MTRLLRKALSIALAAAFATLWNKRSAVAMGSCLVITPAFALAGQEDWQAKTFAELVEITRTDAAALRRRTAAVVLGQRFGREAYGELTRLAGEDPSDLVKCDAIDMLRQVAARKRDLVGEAQYKVLEANLTPPGSGAAQVREAAVSAYASLKGAAGLPQLMEVLGADPSPKVRYRAISRGDFFWTQIDRSPPAVLKAASQDTDANVSRCARAALADIADADSLKFLAEYFTTGPQEEVRSLAGRLGRNPKVPIATLLQMLEPCGERAPEAVIVALDLASRTRPSPELADMAVRMLPRLPPDLKELPFLIVGRVGTLRHLPLLQDGGDPAAIKQKYGPVSEKALGRIADEQWNGSSAILQRELRPEKLAAVLKLASDTPGRREFVAALPLAWDSITPEGLPDVVAALTPEERRLLVLVVSPRACQKRGVLEIYGVLASACPTEAVALLPEIYPRFYDQPCPDPPGIQYFLACFTKTEDPRAARFIYEKWCEADKADPRDAKTHALFAALLQFKTAAAEPVFLRILSGPDLYRRDQAVQQLGRIGGWHSVIPLGVLWLTAVDAELGGGDIRWSFRGDLDRSIGEIVARDPWARIVLVLAGAAALAFLAAGVVVIVRVRKRRRQRLRPAAG